MPHRKDSRIAVPQIQAHPMNDRATDVVAGLMVASVWYAPSLEVVSTLAATLSPILGMLWLLIQIFSKLNEWHTKWVAWKEARKQARLLTRLAETEVKHHESTRRPEMAPRRKELLGDEGDTWP